MESMLDHKRELSQQELSQQEHRRAQEIAYFIAMKRGNGKEPSYDPLLAARDFCQAAGELRTERETHSHERRL
jgi:hypothetical protein